VIKLLNIKKKLISKNKAEFNLIIPEFSVNESEFICIQGQSGSGKSTLLSILGLLDYPDLGQYLLRNINTHTLSDFEQSKLRNQTLGFLFQDFRLIPELTVLQNIEIPLQIRNSTSKSNLSIEKIKKLLEEVNLIHRINFFPNELSGGEMQRVAFARAMVNEPSLLLADEPTGNLDAANRDIIMGLINSFHQNGGTVILVSHDQVTASHASRQVKIHNGMLQSF
jgi:putative ABC transport system ATP-binding protein